MKTEDRAMNQPRGDDLFSPDLIAAHLALPVRLDAAAEPPRLFLRFICANDPSRAFIAEAFVRDSAGGAAEAWAHGDPADVHPAARRVMNEIGVSLRDTEVTTSIPRDGSDLRVIIQDRDSPSLSDAMTWHFDDPAESGDEVTKVAAFRRVRDEIKRRVDLFLLVKRPRRPRKGEKRQELGARPSSDARFGQGPLPLLAPHGAAARFSRSAAADRPEGGRAGVRLRTR
jgi:protein-tyrosine-phosphatase